MFTYGVQSTQRGVNHKNCVGLTFDPEVDGLDLDWDGVDLTVVDSLVPVPDFADVKVPVLGEGPFDGQSLVIDNSSIFVRQKCGELICPHHLVASKQTGE